MHVLSLFENKKGFGGKGIDCFMVITFIHYISHQESYTSNSVNTDKVFLYEDANKTNIGFMSNEMSLCS